MESCDCSWESGAPNRAKCRHQDEEGMMSNQQIDECASRLQYLFEVLHVIRKIKGDRFPDVEAELSRVLGLLTVSGESVAFQEVMRFCDQCADSIESKVRECSDFLHRRRSVNRGSGTPDAVPSA